MLADIERLRKQGTRAIWKGPQRSCADHPVLIKGMSGIYMPSQEEINCMFYPVVWGWKYGIRAINKHIKLTPWIIDARDRKAAIGVTACNLETANIFVAIKGSGKSSDSVQHTVSLPDLKREEKPYRKFNDLDPKTYDQYLQTNKQDLLRLIGRLNFPSYSAYRAFEVFEE